MGFVEQMKWWQWIALSLGLGALLGYLNSGGANTSVEHSSVSQMVFETGLMQAPYVAGKDSAQPFVSNVVVHPVQQVRVGTKTASVQLVTFDALNPHVAGHPSGAMERVSMLAAYPYEPQPRHEPTLNRPEWPGASMYYGQEGDTVESLAMHFYHKVTPLGENAIIGANDALRGARNKSELKIVEGHAYWIPWDPANGHTVSDFLTAANKLILSEQGKNAIPVSFHFTWWESTNHAYAIWMTGTFLLVGLIWPTLIHVMVKGGLGRTNPEEFKLSSYKPGAAIATGAAPAKGVTKEDMDQLREMEEALTASLKSSGGVSVAAAENKPAAPAIKVLDGAAEPAAAGPERPQESKAYQGEFYPVVRSAEKKTD